MHQAKASSKHDLLQPARTLQKKRSGKKGPFCHHLVTLLLRDCVSSFFVHQQCNLPHVVPLPRSDFCTSYLCRWRHTHHVRSQIRSDRVDGTCGHIPSRQDGKDDIYPPYCRGKACKLWSSRSSPLTRALCSLCFNCVITCSSDKVQVRGFRVPACLYSTSYLTRLIAYAENSTISTQTFVVLGLYSFAMLEQSRITHTHIIGPLWPLCFAVGPVSQEHLLCRLRSLCCRLLFCRSQCPCVSSIGDPFTVNSPRGRTYLL